MPTKPKPVPVYWDSCVFIAAIQQESTRYTALDAILAEAKDGKIVLVASVLVRCEVAKLNQSTEPLADQVQRIAAFFENDFIELRDITEEIAAEAAAILRDHNLKPLDALHVATALHTHAACFTPTMEPQKSLVAQRHTFWTLMEKSVGRPSELFSHNRLSQRSHSRTESIHADRDILASSPISS